MTTTRPSRPSPQAPETTGTSEYAVAPIRSSQRGAPSGLTSRPATRRKRQEPHRASGTASSSSAEIVTVVPRSDPTQREGQQVGRSGHVGAGAEPVPRLEVQPPPVADRLRHRREAGARDRAVRRPREDQRSDDEDRQQDGHRVGQEPRDDAGVLELLLGVRVVEVGGVGGDPARGHRRRVELSGGGAATLGDVGGLVGQGRDEVAHRRPGRGGRAARSARAAP